MQPPIMTVSPWARRRDQLIVWLIISIFTVFGLWIASHIIRSLLVLLLAMLLAYALAPLVAFVERVIPRFLAIVVVYVVALGTLGTFFWFAFSTAFNQLATLTATLQNGGQLPIISVLHHIGLTDSQIATIQQRITSFAEAAATQIVPYLLQAFNAVFDTIITLVLSIYFLIDGLRLTTWLRERTPEPQRSNIVFFIDLLERVVGGYIRGQVILALLVGILVGIGMFIFQVPYAVLLGAIAFILAFIPVLGTFVSGAICVGLAFTNGWLVALGVLLYFVGVHIIEGDVVGPRIVGRAIGVHPGVSMIALIAGSEVFGIWGALLGAPLAGIAQALLTAGYINWQKAHPHDFKTTIGDAAIAEAEQWNSGDGTRA